MNVIEWIDAFDTGIELVDTQHRWLVDLINAAANALTVESPSAADGEQNFDSLIQRVFDYTREHFSDEEQLMRSAGIDERHLSQHHALHVEFVRNMEALAVDTSSQGRLTLLSQLTSWLAMHILDEDQRMAAELRAIARGLTPAEAWDRVEGEKADILRSANKALAQSMLTSIELMRRHNAELAKQVDERTRELQQSNRELTRARNTIDDISNKRSAALAALSHEMMTPLNAILGFSHLLSEQSTEDTERSYTSGIERAGTQLYALFSQILMYAKLESSEDLPEAQPFDPSLLPSKVHERVARVASSKGLGFELLKGARGTLLLADEDLLVDSIAAITTDVVRQTNSGVVLMREEHSTIDASTAKLVFTITYTPTATLVVNATNKSRQIAGAESGLGFSIGSNQLARLGFQIESSSDARGMHRIVMTATLPFEQQTPADDHAQDAHGGDAAVRRLTELLVSDDLESRSFFEQHRASLEPQLGETVTGAMAIALEHLDLAAALAELRSAAPGERR